MRAESVAGSLLVAFVVGVLYGGWSAFYGHHRPAGTSGRPYPGLVPSPRTTAPIPAATGLGVRAHADREPDGAIVIFGVVGGAAAGDRVVVQRADSGGWTDLPARTTTGPGGRYSVTVPTPQRDVRFRVRDDRTGRSSASLQPAGSTER